MKFIKDERIARYEDKYRAEAFNIMMAMGVFYVFADALQIDLGPFTDDIVLIMVMVGGLYSAIRLTAKGMGAYSPIKGMHPIVYYTIICLIASIFTGAVLTIRNTNLYLDGNYTWSSLALFVAGFYWVFILTELLGLTIYFISRKQEEKEIRE